VGNRWAHGQKLHTVSQPNMFVWVALFAGVGDNPAMDTDVARIVAGELVKREASLNVVDVGVSGGMHELVRYFPECVRAVGFDGLKEEIARLQAGEANPSVSYEWALVGDPAWNPISRGEVGAFARSTAEAFATVTKHNYVREIFNGGAEPTFSTRLVRLDDWVTEAGWDSVDFLKVDTDGHDLGVLRSSPEILTDVLAVLIEAPFDGVGGPDANTFTNISKALEDAGLRLFDLTTWRYSKAAFPMPFAYEIPAQTLRGQIVWGDALFMRDMAVEGDFSQSAMLKMIALLDYFQLQDCAVELLDSSRTRGLISDSVRETLYIALGESSPLQRDPREMQELFNRDPTLFFPSRRDEFNQTLEAPSAVHGSDSALGGQAVRSCTEQVPSPPRIARGHRLVPAAGASAASMLFDGWHDPEPNGAWSSGVTSQLRLVAEDCLPERTEIRFTLSAPASVDFALSTRVTLAGSGLETASSYEVGAVPQECVLVCSEGISPGDEICVSIMSSRLVVPSLEGWSDDERTLGVFLSAVRIGS
jgi:FkbM family methyltransferase